MSTNSFRSLPPSRFVYHSNPCRLPGAVQTMANAAYMELFLFYFMNEWASDIWGSSFSISQIPLATDRLPDSRCRKPGTRNRRSDRACHHGPSPGKHAHGEQMAHSPNTQTLAKHTFSMPRGASRMNGFPWFLGWLWLDWVT